MFHGWINKYYLFIFSKKEQQKLGMFFLPIFFHGRMNNKNDLRT